LAEIFYATAKLGCELDVFYAPHQGVEWGRHIPKTHVDCPPKLPYKAKQQQLEQWELKVLT
jgi:hypothetical protein